MDSVPILPPGQLLELEQFARERTFSDRVLLAALLPLIPVAHAEAVRRGDPHLAYQLVRQASEVMWSIKSALAPVAEQDAYHGRLWQRPNKLPDPLMESSWLPDQVELEAAVASYLEHPWMSAGYLDWALIDAFTQREIIAYEANIAVKLPRPWTSIWMMQKALTVWMPWLIEVAVAVASVGWLWSEFSSDAPYRWWWASGATVYYVWWAVRFLVSVPMHVRYKRARRKELLATAERLQTMHRCYDELSGPVLDPTRVRDALLAAEKLEVRWSRATWPLLEAAIARHPHRWATGY